MSVSNFYLIIAAVDLIFRMSLLCVRVYLVDIY